MRGIFYIEDEKFIEPPYVVQFFAARDEAAKPVIELLEKFDERYARGPGIIVRRALVPEHRISSLFDIEIWKQFRMYAAVSID